MKSQVRPLRIKILQLMIISIPFAYFKIYYDQLNLPFFLFFLYGILSSKTIFEDILFRKYKTGLYLLAALYLLIISVSIFNYVPYVYGGYSILRQLLIVIPFFYLVSMDIINENLKYYELMKWYITGVILLSLAFIFKIELSYSIDMRLFVMGINPNSIALFCISASLMMYHLIKVGLASKKVMIVYLIFIPILIYITILTGSRGGLIGLLIGISIYFFFDSKGVFSKLSKVFQAIIVLIFLLVVFFSNEIITTRFSESDTIISSRLPIWETAFSLLDNDMLFGIGVFRYEKDMTRAIGMPISTHNEYLSVLVYSGIIGLVIFIMFILILIKSSLYAIKFHRNPVFISLLSVTLFQLFKGGGALILFFTWITFALSYSSDKKKLLPVSLNENN